MKYVRLTLILFISLSFSYCLRTRAVPYPDATYSPTNPKNIKIYYKPPSAPFEIIGEVKSEGTSTDTLGRIERYMKKRAATIGGDGIILINKKEKLGEVHTGSPSSNAFICGDYIYYAYKPGTAKPMLRDQIKGLVINLKSEIIKEEKINKKEQIQLSTKKEIVEKRKKSYPKGFKIKVIKEGAVLRLKPNEEALIIKKLPIGGLLEALESIGEWIKIILLPDKDGIAITGYIHNSFIEFETKPVIIKPEKIITTPEKKIELAVEETDKGYISWKNDLARAKGKSSTGLILTIAGGLVFVPCMVLTFVHRETKYEYGYWGLVQFKKKKVQTSYLIGDAIGLVALISGIAIHLPAHGEVKRLENEGRRSGYIKAGLLPKYKAIGIQIGISF